MKQLKPTFLYVLFGPLLPAWKINEKFSKQSFSYFDNSRLVFSAYSFIDACHRSQNGNFMCNRSACSNRNSLVAWSFMKLIWPLKFFFILSWFWQVIYHPIYQSDLVLVKRALNSNWTYANKLYHKVVIMRFTLISPHVQTNFLKITFFIAAFTKTVNKMFIFNL